MGPPRCGVVLCQFSGCHNLRHGQLVSVAAAPADPVGSPLALSGVQVGKLFATIATGELFKVTVSDLQLFATLSVVERLGITGRGIHPVAIYVTSDVAILITNHRRDPQMCGPKRRHATAVDQLTDSFTILVVLSQDTTVALQITVIVAIDADDTVVRQLVSDTGASSDGRFLKSTNVV